MSGILWVLTLGALVAGCRAVDQTRQPGALGASVVESVVSLIRESCLFADDKRFLRRLAYVQSRDGTDPKTYGRSNYHGGIWQVDQDKFRETQTTSGLQNEKNIIRNTFGINWDYVSWSELRKPLYSGIAAALYIKLHSAVAWRIEDQANTYELLFQSSGGHNFTNVAKLLDQGCHGNETLDLVFVVDSSNSLSSDDFTRAKHFMNDVVDAFNIASDKTRVSVITYSTTPRIEFYLSSYSSKSSLKNAIQHLPFHPGTTNTAAALQLTVNNVFASSRPQASKVVIVITDGQSDDVIYTQHAADNAKNDGIIMFSVGVGSTIDTTELNYMASTPSCTHVFTMSGYDEIRALKEELIQSSCRVTTSDPTRSTTEIQTTPFFFPGPNVTIGSRGRQFIVVFMKNIIPTTRRIFITSENGVQMNISTSPHLDPMLKSQIDQSIDIPSNQELIVPSALELDSFKKEVKSIFIETSADVFIISHDDGSSTVGSTTHIPLHKLSNKYVVISTEPHSSWKSQLAVSATVDNTTISITFKMKSNLPLNIEGNTYYNGSVFIFSLDRYETYQIAHDTDLTGTFIESSAPIAAFSGNDCNNLENIGACDHLIEQLPPTDSVDSIYIVPPNANNRDTLIRITSIESSNTTFVIGNVAQSLFINKLDHFDVRISSSQTCFIASDQPNLVTSFGLASSNSTLGDPSMTIVPGLNQYLSYYKIVVPSGYDFDYVSIMIKHSFKDSFRINGTMIKAADIVFEEDVTAGNLTYNVRTIRVSAGELTAYTVDEEKFGLMFAGVSYYEAYGFSGNSLLL